MCDEDLKKYFVVVVSHIISFTGPNTQRLCICAEHDVIYILFQNVQRVLKLLNHTGLYCHYSVFLVV